ncbi:LuxR C-terminal-related transcriptional regulator [Spirillospora sp. NPDC047279]|uniref:ATP-binding protein n=1 Tax=Spirillospora sp. NPDC047279 TaxID=3155478 RepID=UPI0033E5611A
MTESGAWSWAKTGARYEPTGFIGRAAELTAVEKGLAAARVVTLTGPGGIGKTRIALRAAHRAGRDFPDGVSVVELSGLRDAEFLPNEVAAAVGMPEADARESMDQLLDYFADKRALLVLDTCEHLVGAVAAFADMLVGNCAHLVLLLTSRQPVALPGEHVLAVPPMPEPDSASTEETNDTVALFVARARAARPEFALDDDNRSEVVMLCRRLDGMPLAIELAAARLRTMTLDQILRRLDNRLQVLAGSRAVLARHQTLRATIEWSHDLCSPAEKELWARLSVFAGGFSMAAVEEVCAGNELDGFDVIDLLLGLVDKSVVQRIDNVEEDRYRMLDTLREFGAENLERAGRTETYAARHQRFFLRVATRAGEEWFGDQQLLWGQRLKADLDNFRVALDFAIANPTDQASLRIANGLWGLWLSGSRLTEARRWFDKALEAEPDLTSDHVIALFFSAYCGVLQGDPRVQEMIVRVRTLAEELDDDFLRVRAEYVEAAGAALWVSTAEAIAGMNRARELAAAAGDPFIRVMTTIPLAAMHAAQGDPAAALLAVQDGLAALAHIPRESWNRNLLKTMRVLCHLALNQVQEARDLGRATVPDLIEQSSTMAAMIEYLAWAATADRDFELAATLLGGSGALWRRIGRLLWGELSLNAMHTKFETDLIQALGGERFTRLYTRGAALTHPELSALATGDARQPPPTFEEEVGSPLGPLTNRERQVARLIAEGLSNRQIAERLVISKRTADAHVEHILTKLGFRSRTQVAAMIGALKDEG